MGAKLGDMLGMDAFDTGIVLLAGLTTGFTTNVTENGQLPVEVRDAIVKQAESGIEVVPLDEARAIAKDAGLPDDQVDEVVDDYAEAELLALKTSMLALLTFWPARGLPTEPLVAKTEA